MVCYNKANNYAIIQGQDLTEGDIVIHDGKKFKVLSIKTLEGSGTCIFGSLIGITGLRHLGDVDDWECEEKSFMIGKECPVVKLINS